MKNLIINIILFGFTIIITGQEYNHGHINPDTLDKITVTGNVIVDETTMHATYYLDEDIDGKADYYLNFGPYWYNPDSSFTGRPLNGESITVNGVVHNYNNMSEQSIIVYELNGEFWRDPYLAEWNNIGTHSHMYGNHHSDMGGYSFGWNHDIPETKEIAGTAMLDTTFIRNHYYLDVNDDELPDYFLNFGPYWYEPNSEASKPLHGESIDITGGVIETSMELPVVIVYTINGLEWRDSLSIGSHFGGGWIYKDMTDSMTFHSPFDTLDRMTIFEGWHTFSGGHHGGGMDDYDSLYCQILEILPNNAPNIDSINVIACYEVSLIQPDGANRMRNGGMMGGHMDFNNQVNIYFHYTDMQLSMNNYDKSDISIKYWDDTINSWNNIEDPVLDYNSSTAKISTNTISNYYAIVSDNITLLNSSGYLINNFKLTQNYPNPFNPNTTIKYSIPKQSNVELKIFDVLGSEVKTLVNKTQPQGNYEIEFDGSELTSGIYFYRIKAHDFVETKKMILLK